MDDKVQSIMALVQAYASQFRAGVSFSERYETFKSIEVAIREAIAAPGVADGWVMVPVEPDDVRLKAGVRAFQTAYSDADPLSDWRACYRAFIAAAHSPTAEQPDHIPDAGKKVSERPPYCGSGHCSCIECPYAAPVTIKGGNE